MKTNILITLQIEGFHRWENAPEEVDFLRHRHRHIFHFEIEKTVTHNDRDIEIILFKRKIKDYLYKKYGKSFTNKDLSPNSWWLELSEKSCEMLAEEIINEFGCCRVKVTEDGENGAVVLNNYRLLT